MDEIVFLDLHKVDLYGWEVRKPEKKIDNIIRGINEGVDFEPIEIYKINDNTYQLNREFILNENAYAKIKTGGHSRSNAHAKTNTLLKCMLKGTIDDFDLGDHMPVKVNDIKAFTGAYAEMLYSWLKKRDPNYK